VIVLLLASCPPRQPTQDVGEKTCSTTTASPVYEFFFPPGFKGEEHAAVADEFAYVLDR